MDGDDLFTITFITDFIVIAFSLWFALYLMVRSRSNRIAYRAVLALLGLSFYYCCAVSTTLNPEFNTASWRALSNILTLTVIQHLTYYLLPEYRQAKHHWIARAIPLLGLAAVVLILAAPIPNDCDIRYICAINTSFAAIYPDALELLIFLAILYNLWWIFRSKLRLNNRSFYLAVLIGSSAVGYAFLATLFNRPLPRFVATSLVLVALVQIGYSVTRHQALVEKRITPQDYPVSLLTITILLVVYMLVAFQLGLSLTSILILSILVILSHAGMDIVRDYLDRLQLKQDHEIRFQLRNLGRIMPSQSSFKRSLKKALIILCHNLEAANGFIAVREADKYVVYASQKALPVDTSLTPQQVESEHITQSEGHLSGQTHWIVPAFGGGQQVAAIGIGPRTGMKEYTEADSFWIEDVADQIGALVFANNRAADSIPSGTPEIRELNEAHKVETMELLSALATRSDPKLEAIVEEGFRNFHDYSKLARSPLVKLLNIDEQSHIDTGKQVQQGLLNILEQLRPEGDEPPEPMSREWYCYTILRDAYIQDVPTRDIMAKLYISEGTYYRTRRKALRMISRELMGMGSIA
jgi:hypothetical protein